MAGVAAAGVVTGGFVPLPADAAPAGPVQVEASGTAASAAACNPNADQRMVHSVVMRSDSGVGDWGDASLWYSPACRTVRAKAVSNQFICGPSGDGYKVKAYVVHNGNVTAQAVCPVNSSVALTAWVSDAGIRQAAKGETWVSGRSIARGTTPAY